LQKIQKSKKKARNEVFEKVTTPLTSDLLKELKYLDGLIRETSRLCPPVPGGGIRYVPKDTIICDVKLPAGTSVLTDLISMGYDPKIWPDPEMLIPERWFPENLTKEQRRAWMPFSEGPRICIGMNFSLTEQKIFLVSLLKRFSDIKLAPNAQICSRSWGVLNAPDIDKLLIDFVESKEFQ